MTPREIYDRKPESVTNDINILRGCYYNHIPEIDDFITTYFDEETIAKNELVEIRVHKDFDFDGRRFWRVVSVWFKGYPVMIAQNAGREGDDSFARFITDPVGYKSMVDYIFSILSLPEKEVEDIVDIDQNITHLGDFYGNSLDGSFERYYY
jgi:hypothetical protein